MSFIDSGKLTLTFFLLLILVSCERDMDMSKYRLEDKLVLNCFITSDSTIELSLCKTSYPYDQPDWYINQSNAIIQLRDSNHNVIELERNEDGTGYIFPQKLRSNYLYTITVDHPGFHAISAQDHLPSKIEVIDYKAELIKNDEDHTVLNNTFTINTRLARYLAVRHIIHEKIINIHGDTISFNDTVWISPTGHGLKSIIPGNLLNNILFAELLSLNGNMITSLSFESYDGFAKTDKLIEGISEFELISCSENCYKYLKSSLLYSWNKEDENKSVIFPVSVFSNIENGFGIFCGIEKTVYRVKYR